LIRPAHLPPAAGPGDRVGVAALSGPVRPDRLEAGVAALRGLGFEPVLADNLLARHGLFAGSDAERLAAFHRLAADPDLPAIFFARGGSGLLRVLPGIDWDLLARRPRAYVGYSDLTPFLLAVVARLGLVAFHGPLVAAELARGLAPGEEASLLGALAGRYPAEVPFRSWLRPPRGGAVAGPLLGGCLSLLAATVGTPFLPDLSGGVLFWEEINEAPYRVDRMLTHLRLSDNLAKIEAMIVGHLDGGCLSGGPCREISGDPSGGSSEGQSVGASADAPGPQWPALVEDSLAGFSWPLAWGLDSGHLRPNGTLPLGLTVSMDGGERLRLGEG
jgi:muramoyltetrapeptide carboxypeptidase